MQVGPVTIGKGLVAAYNIVSSYCHRL